MLASHHVIDLMRRRLNPSFVLDSRTARVSGCYVMNVIV